MMSEEDVDETVAAIGNGWGASTKPSPPTTADLTEVRGLFAQLAANHVRQVRDFMLDLRSGEATADWIAICDPALRSLRRAAEKLDFLPLCDGLDRLSEALATAHASDARTISGEAREPLLARYEALVTLMPQAFALDLDRSQRESIILQSLLMQVEGVRKVTIDRLYAAGLTTLEAMRLATAADVAATAGVPEETAARIVERFRAYRAQINSTAADATRAGEREKLAQLAAKLRGEQDAFERASESWSPGASDEKRELRKVRAQTLLDIQVLLARLGEVERLAEIERLPFEKKVSRLEEFLEEARTTYARPG
ncbi:MAG: helix-hairpin-helix domain-containing protein [Polyangiaceae bacterium]